MIFYLDHTPIPQKRPKFSFKRVFNPQYELKKQIKAQFEVQIACQTALEASGEAYEVNMVFGMPMTKMQQSRCLKTRIKNWIGKWHTKKPDKDNLEKFYLDVLTEIAFPDDAAVSVGKQFKVIANRPFVAITINKVRDYEYNVYQFQAD